MPENPFMHPLAALAGDWTGTNAFRLMPIDELASALSVATVHLEARGEGVLIRYIWVHPDDGEQSGTLLIGSPAEDGTITAALIDSWHQKPDLATLTGRIEGDGVRLEMSYAGGWGWIIEVGPTDEGLAMTMHNVIPEGVDGAEPGPYPVMVGRFSARS